MPSPAQPRARLTEGSILRHVVVMTLTGSVGLIAIFAVDLANVFYISLLGVAELAAAIGYSGAVVFFQNALCIGLSIGTGALVGRAVGAGRTEDARRIAGASMALIVAVSAVVGVALLPFLDGILALLGAEGRARELASGYLHLVSPMMPLVGLGMGLSTLLRAVGDARRSMSVALYGALATAALDPVLILWLDLGLTGAAIATLVSRLMLVAVGWHGAVRVHGILGPPVRARFIGDARALLAIAAPAMLTNVATPVASSYVTASLARFGDAAVAGQATVDRLLPVAFGVIFALTGAVGPVFAQNLGAGRDDRVRDTLRASMIVVVAYVLAAWLVLFLGQDLLVRMFSAEGVGADLLRLFCNVLAGSCLFLGFLFVANAAFNNLGFPLLSTAFNWGRATLGTVPLASLGAGIAGAQGVVLGQALGTVVFGVAALVVAFRVVRPGAARPAAPGAALWRAVPTGATSGKASVAVLAGPGPAAD
ncbi:MATE family efflux transporter [Arenibaculum pallidiluteum]|uniref:MATE family efflux transporter n=1 Tax=Arenibaculum pallidiluteum TaxID=2812559 RepID=UPI002E2B4F1F|nr:MATE family efflux transporter [Arenibaculum pallidiluteum]